MSYTKKIEGIIFRPSKHRLVKGKEVIEKIKEVEPDTKRHEHKTKIRVSSDILTEQKKFTSHRVCMNGRTVSYAQEYPLLEPVKPISKYETYKQFEKSSPSFNGLFKPGIKKSMN